MQKLFSEYGRHLLYRKEDDRFIVKNDSILPIMWQIHNPQDFVEDFIIAQTSGIVQRHDNQVVPVTYIACRVGVISHKALTVDVNILKTQSRHRTESVNKIIQKSIIHHNIVLVFASIRNLNINPFKYV